MWHVQESSGLPQISKLEASWNTLFDICERQELPLSYAWFFAWAASFGRSTELHVLCVHKDQRLVLIAPETRQSFPFRFISLSGWQLAGNGYSPSGGLVIDSTLSASDRATALQSLLNHQSFEMARLRKVPEVEANNLRADAALDARFRFGQEIHLTAPKIHLGGEWADYLASRPDDFQAELAQKQAQLAAEHDIRVDACRPAARHDPLFEEMFACRGEQWEEDAASELAANPDAWEFIMQLIDRFAATQHIVVWTMRAANSIIAYEFQVQYRGIAYPLIADVNQGFAHLAPGTLLLHDTLKSLFEDEHMHLYDSCADDYEYLQGWLHTKQTYVDLNVYAKQPRALLAYTLKHAVLPALRKLKPQGKKVIQ